ncbi:MAG: hypothetical protein E6I75_25515 [Chloroflexi bacterium]|nr:MAG: hypothetical protein E6I75_25515 [Chloroflexota bacterium]
MGFVGAESTFQGCHCLREIAHLEVLPAAACFEDAQCPVLTIPLSGSNAFVSGLEGFREAVEGGKDPGSEVVGQSFAGVIVTVKSPTFGGGDELERSPEIGHLIMHSGLGQFEREPGGFIGAGVHCLAGLGFDPQSIFEPPADDQVVE